MCAHTSVCVCVYTEMEVGMRETVTRLCVCAHGDGGGDEGNGVRSVRNTEYA